MTLLDQLIDTLGAPQAIWKLREGSTLMAAVGRWRHNGAQLEYRHDDFAQFVFNVSGGQQVEIRAAGRPGSLVAPIRAGSIGLVAPRSRVTISGHADTVQILISRKLLASESIPTLTLQAAGAQALVALARGSHSELEQLVRGLKAGPSPTPAPRGSLSPATRSRLDAMMEGSPTLEELADAAGLSIFHFIRAFRKTEGTTPHARILERRIDRALNLLLQPGSRVDEVGEATGFDSPSHFISAFRRRAGVTPGALRDAAKL